MKESDVSKQRGLGPANMIGVPEEEIVLAKMIQSATDRGLKPCIGTFYMGVNGKKWVDPSKAVACCALGALELDEDFIEYPFSYIGDGNDGLRCGSNKEEALTGYTIGAAFQEAMSDE